MPSRCVIITNGVYFRPIKTKLGDPGWIVEIIFKHTKKGKQDKTAYIITKTFLDKLKAKDFHDCQIEAISHRWKIDFYKKDGLYSLPYDTLIPYKPLAA